MNLTYTNQVLNKILCDIKELQNHIFKKIKIFFNEVEVTDDVDSINFTGNVVVTNTKGDVTVNIPVYTNDNGDVDLEFNGDRPVTRNVLGLLGDNLETQGVIDTLEKLLYPYLAPSITLSAPANSVFEKTTGTTNITLTATSSKNSLDITEFLFLLNDVEISDVAPVDTGGETASYIHATPNTDDTATTPILQIFTATASDINSTTESNTRTRTLVYPYFYGVGISSLDAEDILALNKLVEIKGNKTLTFSPENEKIYFAYPVAYDELSEINDGALDVTSAFSVTFENLTMLDGQVIQYAIFASNNLLTVNNYTLNFLV